MALCLNLEPFRLRQSAWSPKMSMGPSHCGYLELASLGVEEGYTAPTIASTAIMSCSAK